MRGGIDLGGTKIQAVVVDSKWNVVGQSRHPTPTKGKPAGVAKEMANALREAAAEAGIEPGDLTSAGVGSPGDVDESTGSVSQARNLPGWEGTFETGPWLADALGTQVFVGNDVSARSSVTPSTPPRLATRRATTDCADSWFSPTDAYSVDRSGR